MPSERRSLRPQTVWLVWAVCSTANVGLLVAIPEWETIPFHLVWVGLTLQLALRVRDPRSNTAVAVAVLVSTGVVMILDARLLNRNPIELTEIPLSAALFLGVTWHYRRHAAEMDEVRRLAELEHRVRERERDFVRNAAHELRTPITVARGHLELIQSTRDFGNFDEDMGVVMDELERLTTISTRMLTLVAAEDPEFLQPAPMDLTELVVDTHHRWAVFTDRQWMISSHAGGYMRADRGRLDAALDALLENAVAFTEPGDCITLRCWVDGQDACIAVDDTGCGIKPTYLPRVFERFSNGRDRRHPSTGGTGLGLAIVKAIVEAHGGTVLVMSEVDVGTTFILRIPGIQVVAVTSWRSRARAPLSDRSPLDAAVVGAPSSEGS